MRKQREAAASRIGSAAASSTIAITNAPAFPPILPSALPTVIDTPAPAHSSVLTGDNAGAWAALVTAAKGWSSDFGKDEIHNDLILFASRNRGMSPDAAAQALFAATGAKQPAQQYATLVTLGLQAYQFAGRWADALATVDKAIAIAGATVPVNDVPVLRYQEADFSVRLDNPEQTAKYGKLAIEAMPPCGAKCPEAKKQDMIYGLYVIGRLFHGVAATRRVSIEFELAGGLGAAWTADDGPASNAGNDFLMRQVACIGGGTTEISRNVVSERVLGMPREASGDKGVPFRDVPRGPARA